MKVAVRTHRPHYRAGFLITEEPQDLEVSDEQLKLLVRDSEVTVEGHPHVSRKRAQAEDLAAYEARETAITAILQAEQRSVDDVRRNAIEAFLKSQALALAPAPSEDPKPSKSKA